MNNHLDKFYFCNLTNQNAVQMLYFHQWPLNEVLATCKHLPVKIIGRKPLHEVAEYFKMGH